MKTKSIKKSLLCFMLCLTMLISFAPLQKAFASSGTIDYYYRFNYQTTNSNGNIVINYTVLQNMDPTAASRTSPVVVASWPNAYRNSLPSTEVALQTTKGTYNAVLSNVNPYNATGWVSINFRMAIQTLEYTYCCSYFAHTSEVVTVSHTVTTAEVAGGFAARTLPGIALMILPQTKIVQVAGTALTILGIAGDFTTSFNLTNSFPSLTTGNYVVTSNWYTSGGDLMHRDKVWADYNRYSRGDLPMYDGTYTAYTFPR